MNKYANIPPETEAMIAERFGRDQLLALATCDGDTPHVRAVNAYYDSGTFYVITYALSNKMHQIANNPKVALCGDWFTAHGVAESLGWFGEEANRQIAEKLKIAFSEWINNGHNNFSDKNTIILAIRLTGGVIFKSGTRYEF